ncbi:MAG: autotransporter outer membrane beta-barrel domain-containing protein, partial [Phascolarctobacterium sp.]|nr:autotransporter outer membrane beta-barrel domain-containing protein [Candidatus Phascolarctobacterium caballi]
ADNTLNLNIKINLGSVGWFQNMNFILPTGFTKDDAMITTTDVCYKNTKIAVDAALGMNFQKGDVLTLIAADTLTGDSSITNEGGSALFGAGILQMDGNNLVVKVLEDFSSDDYYKAPVEGFITTAAMVNQSADLASGEGMANLVENTINGTTDTFGAISAGRSKYKTGSHVDVDGWGILVGAGKTKEWENGEATTYGLFFEYGKGDFDTYNGNVHGDGNSKNQGVGIMARHKMLDNTYYEGNIRFGKQETEWGESGFGGYETDSRYYGIMLGLGHIFPVGKNEIDVYGRYMLGRVAACDAAAGGYEYHFDSVKSYRIRVGGKYNFVQKNSKAKPFIGLAWEHEFKGEAGATITGVGEAPAPSLKGNRGIMEVGCDWDVSKKWTAGVSANAYIGKRKGW